MPKPSILKATHTAVMAERTDYDTYRDMPSLRNRLKSFVLRTALHFVIGFIAPPSVVTKSKNVNKQGYRRKLQKIQTVMGDSVEL